MLIIWSSLYVCASWTGGPSERLGTRRYVSRCLTGLEWLVASPLTRLHNPCMRKSCDSPPSDCCANAGFGVLWEWAAS
jgi:hypothetical protein